MNNLENKTVVITGASSGIGRATAIHAAQQGATVILISRQAQALRKVAEECEQAGGRAIAAPADVTDSEAIRTIAKSTYRQFRRIDAWVNNAAVTLFAKFENAPPEDYRRVIETNLYGYLNGARAVLPYFHEQGGGILINVSSLAGRAGSPYVSAYTTSKFAINGWSESLRMELQDEPEIHVCTILAASIDTPFFQHAANYTGRAVKPLPPVYPARKVAEAIVQCIHDPRREIHVGATGSALSKFRAVAPKIAEKMIARQVEQERFQEVDVDATDGNLFTPMPNLYTVSGGWREPEQSTGKGRRTVAWSAAAAAGLLGAGYFLTRNSHRVKETSRRISRSIRKASSRLPDQEAAFNPHPLRTSPEEHPPRVQ